jgi:transcriptional regulator with XRE-family HTH domain
MEGFGTHLKSAREARKISLKELSRATKIRRAILEDIERDHGEFLLPEVVVKSFIEAYARYVGLDPEETLARYAQWRKGGVVADQGAPLPVGKREISLRYICAGAIGVIIIIIVTFLLFPGRSPREGAQEAAPQRGQKRMVPSKALQSVPSPPSVTKSGPLFSPLLDRQGAKVESSLVQEHTLVIKASERTWIQIQEGSSPPFEVILYAGDSYTRASSRQLSIVIGNAGGVQVTFDGKGVGEVGKAGEVLKLKLPSLEEG